MLLIKYHELERFYPPVVQPIESMWLNEEWGAFGHVKRLRVQGEVTPFHLDLLDVRFVLLQETSEWFETWLLDKAYLVLFIECFELHVDSCWFVNDFLASSDDLVKVLFDVETFYKVIVDLTNEFLSHLVEKLALVRSYHDWHFSKLHCSERPNYALFLRIVLTKIGHEDILFRLEIKTQELFL